MRALIVAAALAVVAYAGAADAAGPFDGQWTGGSPGTGGRGGCGELTATVTIADGKITGQYTQRAFTFPITGTVEPDGTATGNWNKNKLTGKFAGTHFTGSYTSPDCGVRAVSLDKKG